MKKNKLRNQILWISLLTLLLTMLATLVLPLVSERAGRRETVLHEQSRIWGPPQVIAGPVGFIDENVVELKNLTVEGELKTSIRRRGIFKFPIYAAKLQFTGDLRSTSIRKIVMKSRARLRVESATLGGSPLYFGETPENGIYFYKAAVKSGNDESRLTINVAAEGLQSFSMLPVAGETDLRLKSDWNDPSFFGDFMPLEYEIGKTGFAASWKVRGIQGRKWSEIFAATDRGEQGFDTTPAGAFGVALYQPVDIYQATERSVKYAILFIALTLLALFLFEMMSGVNIHPMQYFLAGLGIVIFYLLLLALAEFVGFTPAYMIAAVMNIFLLSRYCAAFLSSGAHTFQFTFIVTGLYTLLYVILKLEEAALLAGSVTLFIALALTMYFTRRVNWYSIGEAR